MRDYSSQALIHGKRKLPAGAKNKHITLLLNPTAGNRYLLLLVIIYTF